MKRTLFVAALIALLTAACGGGKDHGAMKMEGSTSTTGTTGTTGAPGAAAKTVDITMVDLAYQPTTLKVQRGERIEFVFHNTGKIAHDAFLGDTAAQADHEQEMRTGNQGSMGGGHGMGETGLTVDPGKTGQLSYSFDKPGAIEIGCHQAGHYAAGMKIAITVA